MDDIYRGHTIYQTADGSYGARSMGSHPVISETFPTSDDAMNAVDALLRAYAAKARD
jgi:hypothetical protein